MDDKMKNKLNNRLLKKLKWYADGFSNLSYDYYCSLLKQIKELDPSFDEQEV